MTVKRVLTKADFKIGYCPPTYYFYEDTKNKGKFQVYVYEKKIFGIWDWTKIADYGSMKKAQAGIKKMVGLSEQGVWIDP
jgi:hypothetical protein